MPVAIIGRFLAGLGGAGMVDLASVALNGMASDPDRFSPYSTFLTGIFRYTEMADLREVAVLRSYLTACVVLGGLVGAPLGALFTSLLGWRM